VKIDIVQLEFIDKDLRRMVLWLEEYTGFEFTVTSLHRIGDTGVHGTLPIRGIDLRCRNGAVGVLLQDIINENWWYDPDRESLKCALLHGEGYNLHLHLQVHPKTVGP